MSDHRLASIELDAATLPAATAEIEHERRVAIFDLVEKNSFEPVGAETGPYALTLSLQDKKLLEVAKCVATDPQCILLDEVMAGLRPTETDAMVAVFRRLNEEHGTTILLIEHVMRAVMALAQRVYVLHHGEIISHGTPAEIARDPKVLHSYLGAEEV